MPVRECRGMAGRAYHVMNRATCGQVLFDESEDYVRFLCTLQQARTKVPIRLLSYCLMPNHWHLVLWPYMGSEISTYMQLLMNSHLRDLVPRHGTSGLGHVYQGRFKNFSIYNERHFLNVCRYVEANARAAGLVQRAEDWPWCSLSCHGPDPDINLLSPWPILRPRNWLDEVNRSLDDVAAHPAPGWVPPEVPATLGASHRG